MGNSKKKRSLVAIVLLVIFILPIVLALNSTPLTFNITTDKDKYSFSEQVNFNITPPNANFSLTIEHPNKTVIVSQLVYIPTLYGDYFVEALLWGAGYSEFVNTTFSVADLNSSELLPAQNTTTEQQSQDNVNDTAPAPLQEPVLNKTNTTIVDDNATIEEPIVEDNVTEPVIEAFDKLQELTKLEEKFAGKKVLFKKLERFANKTELVIEGENSKTKATIKGDYLPADITDLYTGVLNGNFYKGAKRYEYSTEVFAINDIVIDNATIELEAFDNVDEILYCKNFNFVQNKCPGNKWVEAQMSFNIIGGKAVFDVDHFSAWVGVSVTENASDWSGQGSHNDTQVNGTYIELNQSGGAYVSTGTYESAIFNAGKNVTWKNISWEQETKLYEIDAEDSTVLLLHLNNDSDYNENDTFFYDFSGYNNHGSCTVGDCPNYTSSGKILGAYNFTGVEISHGTGIDLANKDFSLVAWAKRDNIDEYDTIFGIGGTLTTDAMRFGFINDNTVQFDIDVDGIDEVTTVATYNDTDWHFWTGTYNTSNKELIIYRDGVNVANGTMLNDFHGENNTYIGRSSYSNSALDHHGLLDEVAIYEKTLSSQEIIDLYQRGIKNYTYTGPRNTTTFYARSCDDAACSGESWSGPYTNNTLTELSLETNQYFQYKAVLSTSYNTTSPKLYNVTFNYLNESLLVSGSVVPSTQNSSQNISVSGYVNLTNGSAVEAPIKITTNGEVYVDGSFTQTDWSSGVNTTGYASSTGWTQYYNNSDEGFIGDYLNTSSGLFLNVFDSDTWITLTSSSTSFAYTDTPDEYAKDYMYFFSGNNNAYFVRYNVSDNSWTTFNELAAAPSSIYAAGASLAWDGGDLIYGLRGTDSQEFWAYNITNDTWSVLPDIPIVADNGGSLSWDGGELIYALPIYNQKTFYAYNITDNNWTQLANLTENIAQGSDLVSAGDYLYTIASNYKLVRYTIVTDTWETISTASENVGAGLYSNTAYNADLNKLYFIRGAANNQVYTEQYAIDTDTWSSYTDLPVGNYNGATFTINENTVYYTRGGGTVNFYSKPLESYYPSNLISNPYNTGSNLTRVYSVDFSGSGTVKIQIRTAADNAGSPGTWTDWYGSTSTNDYYETSGELTTNTLHSDAVNDTWIQYKATLDTDGDTAATLSSLSVNYLTTASDSNGYYEYNVSVPSPIGNRSVVVEAENDGITGVINISLNVTQIGTSPTANSFNGVTTDFDYEVNLSQVNNLVLENTATGKIEFGSQLIDVSGKDLDAYVKIQSNNISIDSGNLPELNKTATLSMYGLSWANRNKFVILKDRQYCGVPSCNFTSYSSGNLIFDVASFSSYTTKANLQMEIWDTTDFNMAVGTHTDLWRNDSVDFFANLTYTNGTVADPTNYSSNCSISFEKESYSSYYSMTWDSTNNIYNYTDASGFAESGRNNHTFLVNCTEVSLIPINTFDDVMVNWNTSLNIFDQENDSETNPLSNETTVVMNEQTRFYANWSLSDNSIISPLIWEILVGGGDTAYALEIVDLDHDGDQEIIVSTNAGDLYAYYNNGSNYTNGWPILTANITTYEIDKGDFDGDGYVDDIVVPSYNPGGLFFYNETGGQIGTITGLFYAVDVADFNYDGVDDVAAGGNNFLGVYLSNGSTYWSDSHSDDIKEIHVGDVGSDGEYEILYVGGSPQVWVYSFNGSQLFASGDNGIGPSTGAIYDIDNDGLNDVYLGRRSGGAAWNSTYQSIGAPGTGAFYNYDTVITNQDKLVVAFRDNSPTTTTMVAQFNHSAGAEWVYDFAEGTSAYGYSLHAGDVNYDGTDEILVGGYGDPINHALILDENATLLYKQDVKAAVGSASYASQAAVRAVDANDGLKDMIVVSTATSQNNLYAMQTAQCEISFSDNKTEITPDSNTVLLLHLNNDSSIGEDDNYFVDSALGINNGSCTTCPAYDVIGKLNSSFRFNGIDDDIQISDHPSLYVNDTFVMAAWFNIDSFADHRAILGKGSSDNHREHRITVSADERINFVLGDNTTGNWGLVWSDIAYIPAQTWTHVAFVRNNSNVSFYLNGEYVDSTTYTETIPDGTEDLEIGNDLSGHQFKGLIDEVVIYNKTLSSTEIFDLYKKGAYANITDFTAGMTWNSSLNLWEYNASFSIDGIIDWDVNCSKGGYQTQIIESNVTIQPTPDLNLTSVTHPDIWSNETLYTYINISNSGTATATDANVSCYFDDTLFDSYLVNISAGAYNYSSCTRTVLTGEGGDSHTINVTVDEVGVIEEVWENNNLYDSGVINISQYTDFNLSIKTDIGSTYPTYLTGQGVNFWTNWSRDDNSELITTFNSWNLKDNNTGGELYFYINQPDGIAIADLTNDGLLDIAVVDSSAGTVRMFFQPSSGDWYEKANNSVSDAYHQTGSSPRRLILTDLNNDTFTDVGVVNTGSQVSLLFAPSSGNWSDKANNSERDVYYAASGGTNYGVSGGDLNNDGLTDIVTVSFSATEIDLYFQPLSGWSSRANGSLSDLHYNTHSNPYDVATGYFNNDSLLDIVVGSPGSSDIDFYFQPSSGDWSDKANGSNYDHWRDSIGGAYAIKTGDLNDDGLDDVAIADNSNPDRFMLYFQDVGGFQTRSNGTDYNARYQYGGTSASDLALGDLNNDGLLDGAIADSGTDDAVHLCLQPTNGWGDKANDTSCNNYYSTGALTGNMVAIADLNNDGLMDIATTDRNADRVSLFFQPLTTCYISINNTFNKTFTKTSDLYKYQTNFSTVGNYTYNITCESSLFETQTYNGIIQITPDTLAPVYDYQEVYNLDDSEIVSDASASTKPKPLDNVEFRLNWTDNGETTLNQYKFSWNTGSGWTNDTWQNFGTGINGDWSNITKQIPNGTQARTIYWQVYASDNIGNNDTSGIFNFTVQNTTIGIGVIPAIADALQSILVTGLAAWEDGLAFAYQKISLWIDGILATIFNWAPYQAQVPTINYTEDSDSSWDSGAHSSTQANTNNLTIAYEGAWTDFGTASSHYMVSIDAGFNLHYENGTDNFHAFSCTLNNCYYSKYNGSWGTTIFDTNVISFKGMVDINSSNNYPYLFGQRRTIQNMTLLVWNGTDFEAQFTKYVNQQQGRTSPMAMVGDNVYMLYHNTTGSVFAIWNGSYLNETQVVFTHGVRLYHDTPRNRLINIYNNNLAIYNLTNKSWSNQTLPGSTNAFWNDIDVDSTGNIYYTGGQNSDGYRVFKFNGTDVEQIGTTYSHSSSDQRMGAVIIDPLTDQPAGMTHISRVPTTVYYSSYNGSDWNTQLTETSAGSDYEVFTDLDAKSDGKIIFGYPNPSGYLNVKEYNPNAYASSATFTSQLIQTDAAALLDSVTVDASVLTNTSVKFQIAGSYNSSDIDSNFVGSDGTSSTYYNLVNGSGVQNFTMLTNITGGYFKYKLFFETNDTSITPEVYNVTLGYKPVATNASGYYNYTLIVPLTAGWHNVTVNFTDEFGNTGQNSTIIAVNINLSNQNATSTITTTNHAHINETINISVSIPSINIGGDLIDSVWAVI
ncbi:hypothetical protein GOV04_01895, partial [Candidatus Woesearchaeota archaeon]|nr:hypothetical protein [Candidatus Woesearchaeota archaeon]